MKKKILIVEDNKPDVDLLEAILANEEVTTYVAKDGNEAINMYIQEDYDMILLDLRMPIISGLDVLKYIRAADRVTPVYMITATATKDVEKECMNAGATEYITKPFKPSYIKEVVQR